MSLEFHPDASDNFNCKAQSMVSSLGSLDPDNAPAPPDRFPIDPYVSGHIREDEIEQINYWSNLDPTGDETSRYYPADGEVIALEDEHYRDFSELAAQMNETNTLSRRVAESTVRDALGRWIVGRKTGVIDAKASDFVLDQCEEKIADYTVFVPIHMLYLEEPIDIGHVTLRPVSRADFSEWESMLRTVVDDDEAISTWMGRWRKRMQGKAAGLVETEAEKEHALQYARAETARSLSMLRIFNPAMLEADIRCYCTLKGRENVEEEFGIFIKDGSELQSEHGIVDQAGTDWRVSNRQLARCRELGLDNLDQLLKVENPSQFQEQLLGSYRIYSRAAIQREQTEKLLHVFVGLESILLRNSNEPIRKNISERMAFFIRKDPSQRRNVARSVKDAYGPRSGYLHHGKRVKDAEGISEFLRYAWEFFLAVSAYHDHFETKQDFIEAIEAIKYS